MVAKRYIRDAQALLGRLAFCGQMAELRACRPVNSGCFPTIEETIREGRDSHSR